MGLSVASRGQRSDREHHDGQHSDAAPTPVRVWLHDPSMRAKAEERNLTPGPQPSAAVTLVCRTTRN